MKEELIKFDAAKLAKEKGFNQKESEYGFNINGEESFDFALDRINNKGIARPTQSLLQKWLREIHKLNVNIRPDINSDGKLLGWVVLNIENLNDIPRNKIKFVPYFKEYEEALEFGLLEALKLIK